MPGFKNNNSMTDAEGVWKGFDPHYVLFRNMRNEDEGLGEREHQWTEILSWEPRVFRCHNFLSKEECEYIIKLATPDMTKSTVINSTTGKSEYSSGRTSTGAPLSRGRDKIIRDIEKRIADFTFIPVEHGERLYVLHYEVGQKNLPHYDTSDDWLDTINGGPTIATFLMYLSDVEEGGETIFPSAKGNFSWLPRWNDLSEDGSKELSVKPKMGDALLFWNIRPDRKLDPYSKHAGKPVIKGHKWACLKALHFQEYKLAAS